MRHTIWLPIEEPRCQGRMCNHPTPCARRDIPHDKGRKLADFSLPISHVPDCSAPRFDKHIPYSKAVKPAEKQDAREWIGR